MRIATDLFKIGPKLTKNEAFSTETTTAANRHLNPKISSTRTATSPRKKSIFKR